MAKQKLPKGYAATIAQKLGVSVSLVYKVRSGEKTNEHVAIAINALAQKHKKEMQKKINQI